MTRGLLVSLSLLLFILSSVSGFQSIPRITSGALCGGGCATTYYNLTVPVDTGPGLYDLYLELEDGSRIWVPRSVWVLSPSGFSRLRIAHITDLHFLGTPSDTQYLRFTGLLLTQLLGADLVIETGDDSDTASEQQYMESRGYHWAFMYPKPLLLIPGNHDWGTTGWESYYGSREWYRVIGGKILVIGIDTRGEGIPSEYSMRWLEQVLANHTNIPVKIILMHHPVFYWQGELVTYYNSTIFRDPHNYTDSPLSYYWGTNVSMAKWLLRIVEDYNVTMVLAGHIHRDQYVKYVSNRTGTVTYFITTTTLAQSRPNYNGLQIIDLKANGNFTFPYPPPTFIGFGGNASNRSRVYNSIPIDPLWEPGYFYGEFIEGFKAYDIMLMNNLYSNITCFPVSNTVLLALPWNWDTANLEVIDQRGNAYVNLLDYMVRDGILYALLNISMPNVGDTIEFTLYAEEDNTPPAIQFKLATPLTPVLNRTVRLYFDIIDTGWGLRNVTAYLEEDGVEKPLNVEKASGLSYIVSVRVYGKETVNKTIRLVATDLAGNTYQQDYIFTFYKPGENGPYYYGPSEELPEPPENRLPDLTRYFGPIEITNFGPGSPVILYPGETYTIKFKQALGHFVRAYIAGVFAEGDHLVYREYNVSLTPLIPELPGTSTTPATETTSPTTSPSTTTPTGSIISSSSTTSRSTTSPVKTSPTEKTSLAPDYTPYIIIVIVVIVLLGITILITRRKK